MASFKAVTPRLGRAYIAGFLGLGLLSLGVIPLGQSAWPQGDSQGDSQGDYEYAFTASLERQSERTLERSISFYQGRIQQNPTDGLDRAALANLYIQMARATRNESWYLLAEKTAQESLANLPFGNDGAVLALAKVAEAQHDFETAIRLAEGVADPDALGLMVTSKLALGEIEDAAALANAIADQYPSLGSLTLKALAHAAQGKDKQAITDFEQAIAAEEPDNTAGSAQTRVFLGRLFFQRGDHKTAHTLYRQALQIAPDFPLAHLQLAELATVKGQYRAAERHYREVGGPTALHGLARLQALRGREASEAWSVAETTLRRNIEGNALGHRRDLAHLLLERGAPEDVGEAVALMEAEAAQRRDAKTLDLLAWALIAAGREPEAQQASREALDQGVRNAGMAYRAGEIEAALNQPKQAEQYFRLANEIDPTFTPQTRQRLGLITQD